MNQPESHSSDASFADSAESPLVRENLQLREKLLETTERLEEAEAALGMLRSGLAAGSGGVTGAEAFVVGNQADSRVFTLTPADSFYLQLAQEVASAGTWDWEAAHSRLSISDGLRTILHIDPSAPLPVEKVREILHPEDLPRVAKRVTEFLAARNADFYEEFRVCVGGTTRWLACKGRLLRGLVSSSDRVIGICIDITEERALQDAARETNRRKDEFLAMLGHELRNPLAPLTTAAELLQLEAENPGQVRELATMVMRQTDQLRRLIDDLLDVSRITRGKFQLQREVIDLRDVLTAAVDMSRSMIDSAGHELQVSDCGRAVHIDGDRVRLTQVVGNLLINAAKYTPSGGGKVAVALTEENGQARISVSDNGIGIPAELLGAVFGLFTQIDNSDTRSQGGLGVGLALAKTLVELHGGTISVDSEGEGRGSRFVVSLPLASAAETATEAPVAPPKELKRFRILVVDDNAAAVHLLSKLLGKLDQEIFAAESAHEAMAALTDFNPEVIISDIAMPGVSGYDLARGIRSLHLPQQPTLVALTGYGQESDRQAAIAAGFDRHLTKPVSINVLRDLILSLS